MQTSKFLNIFQVLTIHQDQIISFGGKSGIRDQGLPASSSLSLPSFVDSNQRTAFTIMDTLIRVNEYSLNLSGEEAYNLVIQVIHRKISQEELSSFREVHLQPN